MTRPAARPAQPRNNALAQIHIAKVQLGLDDDTYRAMLWAQARVKSAKDLDHAGRARVLAHLKASGFKDSARRPGDHAGKPRRPALDRQALMDKIEAHLADAGRPWAYAHGMARHMFKVDRLEFCDADQLWRIVAGLEYDQARRIKRDPAAALAAASRRQAQADMKGGLE